MADRSDPFEQSAVTTILVVTDMQRSKQFYTDVLGAEIYRAYGGDSLVLEWLGNWLLLVLPGDPTADKPDTRFIAPRRPQHVSHSFTIRVQDCHQSYRILRERGASFITLPHERPGEIRCFFRDPDGHLFEISEAT